MIVVSLIKCIDYTNYTDYTDPHRLYRLSQLVGPGGKNLNCNKLASSSSGVIDWL